MSVDRKYYIVFTPFFPDEKDFRGGYIYDQVKALMKVTTYELVVFKLVNFRSSDLPYTFEGIKVYQIKILDLPSFIFPGLFFKWNNKKIINLLKNITQNRLDHIKFIHGHVTYPSGVYASQIATQLNAKSIVQHHGLDIMSYDNGRIKNALYRYLNHMWINNQHVRYLNKADWNIGVSQLTLDSLRSVKNYSPTSEYVLYNGVDTNKFFPVERTKQKNFTIGCIGNFWPLKDQIILIKAVEIIIRQFDIIDLHVMFVGEGITKNACIEYIHNNNLEDFFSFIPPINHNKLNDFYNSLDLFILPSYYEAFGCVYAEAYMVGVPFIAVYQQGISEIIPKNQQDEFLIQKGDYRKLAQLILAQKSKTHIQEVSINLSIDSLVSNFIKKIE